MSDNHISIKSFLGKYHQELLMSAKSDKYKETQLETFFNQRFYIQNNKTQMIVDPALEGLSVTVCGNEIYISRELYDHPNVTITNTIESEKDIDKKVLYNPLIFSSLAYLVCQNTTMFNIIGELDEPIYVKYKSELETFYNSVLLFRLGDALNIEIVEEVESYGALNAVTNYLLNKSSSLKLTTFYRNILSAQSFIYRNIIAQDHASYSHMQFGRGSSNVIDETRLHTYTGVNVELLGCIYPEDHNFHTILALQPVVEDCTIKVNHRLVLTGQGMATFIPVSASDVNADMDVTSLDTSDIPKSIVGERVKGFVSDVAERAVLERMVGTTRFYENKTKFLQFL